MGSPISDAVLGAVEGVTNFGLGIYDRMKQDRLNRLQMEREDSAYQRAVLDANKAGLSKASISGPASSTPLTAPKSPDVDIFSRAQQAQANRLSMLQQQADISKTMEESKNIQFQNMKFDAESKYFQQNALNEAQILATDLGLKQYEHNTLQKSLEQLRQAQIGYVNGQKSYLEVETDLKKVDRAFELIREHTLLGSHRGEYSEHNGNIVFDKRTQYRLMLLNEMQSKIAQSASMISQYNADAQYFNYYNDVSHPDRQVMYRAIKERSGSMFRDTASFMYHGLNGLFGF